MPKYLVELEDGRKFQVEADSPPTEEEVMASLGTPTPVDSGQGRLSSFASNFGRGALSIGPNVVGGLGYLTGADTLVQGAESMEQGINEALPVNPIYADEFSQKVGNVIGQGVSTLATAGAGGVAGKVLGGARYIGAGAQTGALAPAFLSGSREGGQAAEQYGMTGPAAYARTVGGGLTELATEKFLFGMGTETEAARKLLGEALDMGAGKFAKAVGTEAGEEAAAQIAGNVQTSLLAPEGVQTPGAFEGSLEAGALGAVGGGFFGGVNAITGGPETPQVPVSIESGESVLPVMDGELEEDISPLQVADVESPVVTGLVDEVVAKAAADPEANAITNAVIATLSQPSEEVTPPIPEAVEPVPEAQTQPEVAPPITPDNVPQETPPPSSEAIPEPAPPAVVEATTPTDEIQVEETSGPAPVESLPADEAPAGQTQEGAALRRGKGQEVAAPQPTQKVRFRREGNLITGTYEGQDSLGRHIVNVNGKREYSASRPQVADDAIESISVGRKKGSKIQTSRATSKRPPGLGVPVVEKIVAQFRKQLPNAPNIRIITRSDLDTAEEFQPLRTILQSLSEEGAEPNLEGWLNRETREVFLVSDNLADPQRAREVLIHEIIGHGGVLSVATLAEMRRIAAIIRRVNPDLVAQVEAAYKDIPNATEGDQVGEILAAFAEAYASADPANLPQGWARAWQDLKRIIASIIRKLGGDPNAFDDADLHWFYTNAVRQVYENGLSAEDVTPPQPPSALADFGAIQPSINFPGTPEARAEVERQMQAGVSNARETQARYVAADKRNLMYIPTTEKGFIDDTDAFLDTLPTEEGAQAVLDNNVPDLLKMGQDGRYRVLVANSLRRVSTAIDLATDPYEQARLQALGHELSLRYQQVGTSDGRALKSGATAGSLLAPIAAVLAYQNLIIEKADRIIKTRFNGGAEGAAATVDELAKSSGKRGGREVADALSGEDSTELDAAETLRTKAQESAERIFNSLVKPTEPGVAPKPDPVREVYNEHLKQQMTEDVFVSRLTELGVEKQTAETLFTTAADEIRGRETTRRLKGEAKEKRTKEIAEQRASRLIYRTEERLRQGSKDLNKAADGDTINKAFRDQVKEASEWPVFRDRLAKLNVGEEVAQRLYRTAEREAEDLQAVREIKGQQKAQERRDKILAKDSPKLVEMLNALKAKLYPEMNWRSIFEDLPDQQLARQKEIYDRLRLDERIQGLTTEEAVALTNELDKAWQRQRRKVFLKELERQGVLGEKTEADKEKVKKVLPKLLRAINLGVFNSDMFRQSIATEYGFRPLTAQQSKDLRALAQEAWLQPEGILRNKKLGAVLDSLQKATGASISELVNNYWVASVLTGFATQFDTFMSAANGLGNNLIQAGTLLAKGAGKGAFKVHAQWWAGLKQGAAESLQILLEGDYSVLKRFNKDLNKAMEGESNFRPVPLGESLWKNGNWWQKYGMAPVMMWTGRLMSSADHINNTATTYGAMAAARALYPELYGGKTAFTSEEQAAARAEALQDVTGGKEPTTREERNTVSVRTREILLGLLEQPQQEEASFIGDQAAYQNDPIGMFGSFYNALNAGMGTLERALEGLGESPAVKSAYLRAVLAGLAGGLRGLSGTKFMRFGFNFGNDITQYIPGTYLLQKLAPVYGTDMSRSQQELLLGKNVFGLMAASTIAAMFLGKDDEEEGWHIEGNWSGLSNDVKNQLRSAGKEPLTVWRRREDGSLQRVSYRSWPTGGLFVAVGSMNDQRRYQPAKWAESGIAGNLLRAATNGALHVKDLTAMQGLAEIFGASSFNTDPENDFMERMLKLPSKFVGGFIPTALKDVDAWEDPRSFRPETLLGEFGRNVPIARRYVSEERPLLNLLGEPVKLDRTPWRRVYTESKKGEAYDILGKLLSRGLSLPEPSSKRIVVVGGKKNTIEGLGPKAEWEFARILGEKYKAYLLQDGDTLMALPTDRAQRRIRSRAQAMGDQAEMEMLRKLKP